MNRRIQGNFTLKNGTKICIISILVALLFAPIILRLINVWSTRDDYSHGFFVIPIALYMVWKKRDILFHSSIEPSWIGLPVFFVAAMSYWVSFAARFHTLTYLSMIVIILGLLLFFAGCPVTKHLSLPLLFLLFMFPIPSAYYVLITNPLKLLITKVSTQLIRMVGIPIYREGNLLFLASTQLEVAEACSGIRSLYSYLMLGCLFAIMSRNNKTKILLLISALPLALFVNVVRVSGTGILANQFGPSVAQGFFHEFTGFALFVLGFVFLFLEYHFLNAVNMENNPG